MKLFYLVFIFIFSIISHAQTSDVKEKVENSNKYREDAYKEIKLAISKMENCEDSGSIDFIHSCGSDARKSLSIANSKISYAKNEANNAKEKASEINCSETEVQADKAKKYFQDAESKISYGMRELNKARYEGGLSQLRLHISNAKDFMNQALIRMNYAVNELQNTLDALEDCN